MILPHRRDWPVEVKIKALGKVLVQVSLELGEPP